MSTQLQQILSYLDKDGVTEIVIATGRPVAMRQKGTYVNLTARPLTMAMLTVLVEGTPIAPLIPWSDDSPEPAEVELGKRRLRVRTGRRGDEVVLRLEQLATIGSDRGIAPVSVASSSERNIPPVKVTPAAQAPTERVAPVRIGSSPPVQAAPTERVAPVRAGTSPPATERVAPVRAGTSPPVQTTATERIRPVRAATSQPAPIERATAPLLTPMIERPTPVATPPRGTPAPAQPPARRSGRRSDFDLPLDYDLDELPQEELTLDPGPDPVRAAAAIAPARPIVTSGIEPPPSVRVSAPVRPQPAAFAKLVAAARAMKASDLHIATARVTAIRTNSELVPLDPGAEPLSAEMVEGLLLPLLAPEQQGRLAEVGYVDLAVDAPGGGRLRANISRHQLGLKGTFRLAIDRPRTLEELGLPKDLAKVVAHHQGFVVIAGPSGHGKTTTLAALVDLVNSTKPFHILTVEDPIEIEHVRKVAVVSQREAGRHTRSFATALKASLREDPDVIVIGELRDRETVEIALTASETGHLVLATMSTPSASKTLDRLIDMFPPEEHSQVRASVAGALRAIVAQRLLPAVGGGVVPAVELVTGVLPLAALIRDDKLYQLPNLMQRGRAFGMIRFDESLLELWKAGRITQETALAVAESKKDLAMRLTK